MVAGGGFVAVKTDLRSSSTALSLSAPSVAYGHEQAEKLTATVTGSGGTPTGTVKVTAGITAVCVITLTAGTGSCAVPATRFPPGSVSLTAAYGGDGSFAASASAAGFTVSRAASTTSLALSAAKVTYGKEQAERLAVAVAPPFGGIPIGTVTVKSGSVTVCVITVKAARGTCSLPARKLPAGVYHLVAAYRGSADFAGSVSAAKTLTVVR